MKKFSNKVFFYALPVAITVSLSATLTLVIDVDTSSGRETAFSVAASLIAAVIFSSFVGSYRYLTDSVVAGYRVPMKKIARRAIRSSLSQAMTRTECQGIMDRNGTVALRIGVGTSHSIQTGSYFNIYDSVNNGLWGIVVVVESSEHYSYCEPYDRINPAFWEHLEDRMRHDTSAPKVYAVWRSPVELLDIIERLLDNWR